MTLHDPTPSDDPAAPRGFWQRLLRRVGGALLVQPAPLAVGMPLAWMGLIWYLSSQQIPTPGGAHGLWGFLGNWAHAPLFGLLALFWTALLLRGRARAGWPSLDRRTALTVVLLVVGYGVIDELHQRSTGGRQSSASDVLTDLGGASAVLWVVAGLGARAVGERGLRLRLVLGVLGTALCAWNALYW